ncbi:Clathrin coat assembly protein AP180 [Merluccius polli]|uniref:Clathrin coat assembly protein AP180 n=1 Tax=Merluccius polli TaxID=89951 RepID=A0AA47N8N2_MERPO|nr:Clathrin coat assembly protein AP180 [Merluccius polli]
MSGQTLTDRIAAAQYQLTGSDMARAVCKATTHEVMAPKKKHLEYLVSATNATNVNIPQMADTLFERATNASWVVVFKALVTSHHMCVQGNEVIGAWPGPNRRFIQYLASRTSLFNLSNFIDKTGSHGYDMSTFIRRYGRYLNEKAFAYRQMAFDFTKVKKGADGVMRNMTTEKLLKGMPVLQTQIDTLLEFDVHPKELNNGIINAAFLLLFKDLVKLFASYNDGIINLLDKYFKMKKSDCKEALEIYKRFLTRVTKIGEFMKMAETIGVDKNDIPDINYCLHPGVVVDLADSDDEDCPFTPLEDPSSSSILESLETHMNGLEDVKGGKKGSPTKGSPTNNVSPTSTPAKSSNAVPTLQPPPEAAGAAAAAAAPEPVEDSLLDLDPLSSSGPSAPSAAPTSWGDLLGSEMGDSLLSEPTLAAEPAPSPAGAAPTPTPTAAVAAAAAAVAADTGASLAPPTSTAAAASSSSPSTANMDLLGDAFDTPAPAAQAPAAQAPAAADGGASTPTPAAGAAADPFAPSSDASVAPSPGLDLFAMLPEPNDRGGGLDPCFGAQPSPLFTSASNTITTAAAISAPAPAPCPSSASVNSSTQPSLDLFGDLFDAKPDTNVPAAAESSPSVDLFAAEPAGAEATPAAPTGPGAELMSVFDGLGDVMKPAVTPQAADLDATMASMVGNLSMAAPATQDDPIIVKYDMLRGVAKPNKSRTRQR